MLALSANSFSQTEDLRVVNQQLDSAGTYMKRSVNLHYLSYGCGLASTALFIGGALSTDLSAKTKFNICGYIGTFAFVAINIASLECMRKSGKFLISPTGVVIKF